MRAVVMLTQRQPAASVGSGSLTLELCAMKKSVTRFLQDESGVTAIEFGLIAAHVHRCDVAGQQLMAIYNRIGNALAAAL